MILELQILAGLVILFELGFAFLVIWLIAKMLHPLWMALTGGKS